MLTFDNDIYEWVEEKIFGVEKDYIELGFEYIINCGLKVGNCFDRLKYGFLDKQDELEIKELAYASLFSNCIIEDIFPMVKMYE